MISQDCTRPPELHLRGILDNELNEDPDPEAASSEMDTPTMDLPAIIPPSTALPESESPGFFRQLVVQNGRSTHGAGPPRQAPCHVCGSFENDKMEIDIEAARVQAEAGCASCTVVVRASELTLRNRSRNSFTHGRGRTLHLYGGTGEISTTGFVSKEYRICTTSKTPLHFNRQAPTSGLVTRMRRPSEHSGSHAGTNIQLIRSWLQRCSEAHAKCTQRDNNTLPTRILDIGCPEGIKLRSGTGLSGRYCALSHCWGTPDTVPPPSTTKATLSDREQRIQEDLLPKTFQHAIAISRSLSVRYLWIDSLCIIQDDPGDWDTESAQMDSVYENAYLVIGATGAAHGDVGCFSEPHDSPTLCFTQTSTNNDDISIYVRESYHHLPFVRHSIQNLLPSARFPLLSRSWCLQERLLATRMIHCVGNDLIWECKSLSSCECMELDNRDMAYYGDWMESSGEPLLHHSSQDSIKGRWATCQNRSELFDVWQKTVELYSKLNITNASDRLPALSGLAKRMQSRGTGDYVAGLWKDHIFEDLLWQAVWPRSSRREREWQAPSWSLACLLGNYGVDFILQRGNGRPSVLDTVNLRQTPSDSGVETEVDFKTTLLELEWELFGSDPTGRLKSAVLVLSAPVVTVSARINGDEVYVARNNEELEVNPVSLEDFGHMEEPGYQFHCVWIGTEHDNDDGRVPHLLLLRKSAGIGGRPGEAGAFERVGVISVQRYGDLQPQFDAITQWFENARVERLRIV